MTVKTRTRRNRPAASGCGPGVLSLLQAAAAAALILIDGSGLPGLPGLVFAAETANPSTVQAAAAGALGILLEDDGFVYKQEGRPDPFMPFITTLVKSGPGAKEAAAEELTGMRKFEPGQLTLVAIVFAGREPLAMVQDSGGKGYVLRKGTRIGRSGTVSEIAPNRVVIDSLSYTLAGEERITTVEMLLKQKGEERQ